MSPLSLRSVVTVIGAGVAIVAAVSLPAGYFLSGYSNLAAHLEFKAKLNADYLAKYINSHPRLWQYQHVRIAELLSQTDGAHRDVQKRVFDSSNKMIIEEGAAPGAPVLARRQTVTVMGTNAGQVEIAESLRPLLASSALVALFSGLLGAGIFAALRIFPLRVLDRTLGELERSNGRLEETNGRFDAALNNMHHGLCMFDAEGRLMIHNQRYLQMYDLSPEILKPGTRLLDLLKYRAARGDFSSDPDTYWADLQAKLKSGIPSTSIVLSPDGRAISITNSPMANGGWVATHEDVTERRAALAKISHMARHDTLTNLPNRLFFHEQMEARLTLAGRDLKFAVLCFDLDRFKAVNDTLGHSFGDRLLQQVAERMRSCIREGDTLARLGGDEFAILQTEVSHAEDAGNLAARINDAIAAPFDLDGQQVVIGVSVGLALSPGDATEPGQLLKNADLALYRAKAEGKGTYRFFAPEMDRLMQARRTLELDLRKAIANNELELHYQPLVNLQSDEITGFEALLRWNHPKRGLVPPLDFIPLAEETALIIPLGEWVMRNACNEAAKWPKEISLAINLSPAQFKMRNLSQMVMSALAHSGLAAARLEVEITESVLLAESESTLEILHQLRSLGVRISMDDFGTGYSSLSYLRSFPFDKIKIDRSFVHDMDHNADSKAIVRAVSGLGLSLGIAITGEGVETREELEHLRREGCTEAQGFYFSKAKPASEVFQMLAEHNPSISAVA